MEVVRACWMVLVTLEWLSCIVACCWVVLRDGDGWSTEY